MKMSPLKNIKEMQSFNGRIAALNRFISRVTNKCLSFFKTLKKVVEWTTKYQKTFEELKAYLASPLLLSPYKPNEELSLYLVISPIAINSALIREKGLVQLPVYYTS